MTPLEQESSRVTDFVGASEDRTLYKHLLFSAELGRQAGVIRWSPKGTIPVIRDMHVIDLCAGDGIGTEFSPHTSPGIIAYHFDHAKGLATGVTKHATLYEKSAGTFSRLSEIYGHRKDFTLINDDASSFRVKPTHPNQAIFVYADPNALSQLPINNSMIESFTPYTTFMATLGCNVGGVKRLTKERRDKYIEVIDKLVGAVPDFHDCILVWVIRDASQWAYLVRMPLVWSEKSMRLYKKTGDKVFQNGVGIASLRYSTPMAWKEAMEVLMYTKKERAGNV